MPFTLLCPFVRDDASIQCVRTVDMSPADVRTRSRYAFAIVLDTTYLKGVEALSRSLAGNRDVRELLPAGPLFDAPVQHAPAISV
jgi:hypothetical protein